MWPGQRNSVSSGGSPGQLDDGKSQAVGHTPAGGQGPDVEQQQVAQRAAMGGEHHRAGPLEYADVTGPNYSYRHTWGDGPFFANVWQGNAVGLVNVGGWHSARVSGHAVLSNGAICTSLHPIGTEAIC